MQSSVYLTSAVAAILALWLIWTFGIRRFLLDLLREQIFEVRFELFRLGISGELPFDSEAYRSLEILLCGLLRFGHRITFTSWVASTVESEKAKKQKDYVDVSQQIALRISRLSPETQIKLLKIVQRSHSVLLRYMAFSSLLFLALVCIFGTLKLLGLWDRDNKQVEATTRVIEREAYLAELRLNNRLAVA